MTEKTLVFFGESEAQLFRCSNGNGSVLLITGTQEFILKVFVYCSNWRHQISPLLASKNLNFGRLNLLFGADAPAVLDHILPRGQGNIADR